MKNTRPNPPLILEPELVSASDYLPLPTRFLWGPRIPAGKVTLLIGDPGVGKSLLLAHFAACLTTARRFPDPGAADDSTTRPAEVFIGAPEDAEYDVLVPRLAAAGADLARVHVIRRVLGYLPRSHYGEKGVDADQPVKTQSAASPLMLPAHAPLLGRLLGRTVGPRVLLLDPLTNFLSHSLPQPRECRPEDAVSRDNAEMIASVMSALSRLAASTGAAIIVVGHLTKSRNRRILYRARGSLTLTAGARSVLYLGADPKVPDRRVLAHVKSVCGPPAPPLAFRIGPGPRLEFEDRANDSISSQLSAELLDLPAEDYTAISEACDWLADALAAGPRKATEIVASARDAGHSTTTLRRAKRLLAVRSIKRSTEQDWVWSAPAPQSRQDTHDGGCYS